MAQRVLIVDDSKTALQVMQVLLMGREFEFQLAATAEDALRMADAQPPDLVISDLTMPGMSGIDLCKRLKQNRQHRYTPFLLVTANKEDRNRRVAFAAGASGYLAKPVDPERLIALVDSVLPR